MWLLFLRCGNVLIYRPLVKEKALEFVNELIIEDFQA